MTPNEPSPDEEPTASEISELERSDLRPLLMALLNRPSITYEEIARISGTTVGALRTQRHRNPVLQKLLSPAGKLSSRRGRARELFKINDLWRDTVSRLVADDAPDQGAPLMHSIPHLDTVEELLRRAKEERHNKLRRAFQLWKNAQQRLDETQNALEEKQSRGLLRLDARVRDRIVDLKREVYFVYEIVQSDSGEIIKSHGNREGQVVVASPDLEKIDNYFSHVPDMSLSGYGGAISARSHENCAKANLDQFVALRIDNIATRSGFISSVTHVIRETLALTAYDTSWIPIAKRLLHTLRESPPLSTLPDVRQALTDRLDEEPSDPVIGREARSLGGLIAGMRSRDNTLPESEALIGQLELLA